MTQTARTIRIIYDDDSAPRGWFVRYDTDEFSALDTCMEMPTHRSMPDALLLAALADEMVYCGCEYSPQDVTIEHDE
jgi:hypothetical protein